VGAYLNLLYIGPLSLIIILAVMALAYLKPKTIVTLCFIGFGGLILAAPLVGVLSEAVLASLDMTLPSSWEHRLRMWAYAWQEIQNHPIIGNGFDISRTYQETYTVREGHDVAIISLHPHNIGLQIWLEIGAIGAALGALTTAMLWRPAMVFITTPARGAALAGVITASAIIGATTIGVWQFWWWGSIAFALTTLRLIPDKTA